MAEAAAPAEQDSLNLRRVIGIFLRTWPFIRPSIKHLGAFVAASGVVFVISAFLTAILIGIASTGVIAGDPLGGFLISIYDLDPNVFSNVESLSDDARRQLMWPTVWTAVVLTAVGVVSGMVLYYYSVWIFQQINQRMRVQLIDRLQAQSLSFHANAKTGDAIYRVYQDSAMVTAIIQSIFLEPLMFIGRYLFGVIVVAAFNPMLAMVLALTVLPIMLLGLKFSSPLRIRFKHARETNSALTSWIQESVLGVRIIKATGTEAHRTHGFDERSRLALNAAFQSRVMLAVLGILAFAAIGLAILAVESIAALLSNSAASTFATNILLGFGFAVWNLGTFSAVNDRANNGLGAIRSLISLWGRAQDMAMGLGRVFEILDLEPEIEDTLDARDMPEFRSEVRFDHASFAYLPGRPVLSDIDLVAPLGSITAIVGPTGTGKSTLMSLLLRLADPQEGRVLIDGTDIREFRLDSLRSHISIATQENILFSASVIENIRYATPTATREQVVAAAEVACADAFIQALPQGYDTSLGERATKLSSGQRQRIVIARAIIKDSPILILDEPTAALDAETELEVLASLKRWGANRCIFLITHRLSTIRQADQIVYLRNGSVRARGTHDELIDDRGPYSDFVEAETGQLAEPNA